MTHAEITKGNRYINDFMGKTIKIDQEDVKDIPLAFLTIEDLKFHCSWKWLMPVVIKIEKDLACDVTIKKNTCRIDVDEDKAFEQTADTKMEAVWKAVAELLEWSQG